MKDQFIPYEHAKMMKELGFDKFSNGYYPIIRKEIGRLIIHSQYFDYNDKECFSKENNIRCTAPLYQQAEEWLWEKRGINIDHIKLERFDKNFHCYFESKAERIPVMNGKSIYFDSPVTAHREGILKAIEYLHSQKK